MSVRARRTFRFCCFIALAALSVACARFFPPASPPQIELNAQTNTVDVTGLSTATVAALSKVRWTDADWQSLLRISVKTAAGTSFERRPAAVAGTYSVAGTTIRFTPMFSFDDGREYDVVLDPARLPGVDGAPWRQQLVTAVVGKPAVARTPSTVVTHVYPSADIVPASSMPISLE